MVQNSGMWESVGLFDLGAKGIRELGVWGLSLEDLGKSEALTDFQGAGSGMKRAGVKS